MNPRILPLIAALCLLSPSPSRADLIKQGTSHYKDILVTDTSGNNVTGLTTSSFTAKSAFNGGAQSTITTPTMTEAGLGHYWMLIPSSLTGTPGVLSIVLTTASGTVQTDSKDEIFADVPGGAVASVTSPVTVGTNNDKTGYTASASNLPSDYAKSNVAPSWYTQSGDVFGLLNPLISANKFTTSALSNAPTGGGGGATAGQIAAAVWDEATAGHVTSGTYGPFITALPAATVTAIKADSVLSVALTRHNLGRYTYNATTHVLQCLQDDGTTPIGPPIPVAVNSSGVITSR